MVEKKTRSYSPLWLLTRARIVEFMREPGAVFWVFGFPVVMIVVLGLAFRSAPPDKPRVSVSTETPAWVYRALSSSEFEAERLSPEAAGKKLSGGQHDLFIAASDGGIVYRYDDTRAEGRSARLLVDRALQRAQGRVDPLAVSDENVTEPGSRYVDFLLPGVIGLNLMGSSMWGIGYSVVVSRKRRLLRRFAASPMHRWHFLAAYAFSRLAFLAVEMVALLLFGSLAFGVDIHGSLLSFIAVALVGAASFAGISLLIAARVDSVETANGWLNLVMLPMWLLSGSFFSYERFPELMHPVIQALPLTALNDALRAISAEGASLASSWSQLLVLTFWGGVSFLLALKWFRWQ